jgi:hypothetical protein
VQLSIGVTVVAKRFIQDMAGALNEFIVDVQPADGGPAFRATVRQQAVVVGEPDVGQVVPAFCKVSKQTVKFDTAKLAARAMAGLSAKPAGWDAARQAAPGTPVRAPGSATAGETAAPVPATGSAGRRRSAAELLATGQRMTAVLREFSPSGKTVGELDATLPDPGDPVYVFKAELSIDGATPANPSHEVAIDWADSPLAG